MVGAGTYGAGCELARQGGQVSTQGITMARLRPGGLAGCTGLSEDRSVRGGDSQMA